MDTLESFDDDGVWRQAPDPQEIVRHWPQEMHMVGGPYCGTYLHPHSECVHTVELGALSEFPTLLPDVFIPGADGETVALQGRLGIALHRRVGSDRIWQFVTIIEPMEESAGQRTQDPNGG